MSILREEGPVVQPFFTQVATAFNRRVKRKKMHVTDRLFLDRRGTET